MKLFRNTRKTDVGPSVPPFALLRDICAALSVTLLFLFLVECTLQWTGVRFEGSFYNPDRSLGYVLRPYAHGWTVSENRNYFRVNSDGLADREHSFQRPPGVIRIAIVGDSVSEAKQMPLGSAYWAVLERSLNKSLATCGRPVEVVNFGVAGYSLAQESIVIKDRVWKYDPQIIVLAGTIESFVLRSTRQLSPNQVFEHVPFYVLHNGQLEPDSETLREAASFGRAGALHKWLGDLMNASALLSLCKEGFKKLAADIESHLRTQQGSSALSNSYKESDSFLGPATPELKTAWDVSEALILRARDAAVLHHAEFWLFTLDMPDQVNPDTSKRRELERKLGVKDLFVSDRLFAEFADSQGIAHGTLAPDLLAVATEGGTPLHGFAGTALNSGHWNEIGHRAAGEMIARQMLSSSAYLCCR